MARGADVGDCAVLSYLVGRGIALLKPRGPSGTRVAWLSDIHLNFLRERGRRRFAAAVASRSPDAVLISGDIADGWTVNSALEMLAGPIRCPIYFVLGNHDFYHSGIAAVRSGVAQAPRISNLHYLPAVGVAQLCPGVAVVGHDGWADGRNGDYAGSAVVPNDFRFIHDFQVLAARPQRLRLMQQLADEAATHFAHVLPSAAAAHAHVIAVTHVPPFAGAAFYRGGPSGPDVLPFYSSRCVGEVLLEVMGRYPACRLTVLAGHTHGAGTYEAAPNVRVRTAAAAYGKPGIAEMLVLGRCGQR